MSTDNIKKDGPSTFEPIHPFDMSAPKTWAGTIGMMHWDNDKIVFSKRSLLEFLKSCDLTVNTNLTEIQKLPKYATFGHFSQAATDAAVADLVEAEIADPTTENKVDPTKSTVPRPTRKVVDPPGGKQSLRVFGDEYEETDALAFAPPREGGDGMDVEVERLERVKMHVQPEVDGGARIEEENGHESDSSRPSNPPPGFRPTRKVREGPGGKSTIGQAFFGGYENETEEDRQAAIATQGRKKQQPHQQSSGLW